MNVSLKCVLLLCNYHLLLLLCFFLSRGADFREMILSLLVMVGGHGGKRMAANLRDER